MTLFHANYIHWPRYKWKLSHIAFLLYFLGCEILMSNSRKSKNKFNGSVRQWTRQFNRQRNIVIDFSMKRYFSQLDFTRPLSVHFLLCCYIILPVLGNPLADNYRWLVKFSSNKHDAFHYRGLLSQTLGHRSQSYVGIWSLRPHHGLEWNWSNRIVTPFN